MSAALKGEGRGGAGGGGALTGARRELARRATCAAVRVWAAAREGGGGMGDGVRWCSMGGRRRWAMRWLGDGAALAAARLRREGRRRHPGEKTQPGRGRRFWDLGGFG